MADTTLVVIIVVVVISVVIFVLLGVLFAYCRNKLKKGTNIRRRVVQGEEVVKVRPPDLAPVRAPEIIQDVIYRPPTPPMPPPSRPRYEEHFERRGSWPKREPNPEYVIVRKKHHHGEHKRRRPSLEADRRIYRKEVTEDSYSSSDDESSSAKSAPRMRPMPYPVYPVPVPGGFPAFPASAPASTAVANMNWQQPYMVNMPMYNRSWMQGIPMYGRAPVARPMLSYKPFW